MFCIKRIKTYLRTTMTEKRLTDIALSIENELRDTISLDDVLRGCSRGGGLRAEHPPRSNFRL